MTFPIVFKLKHPIEMGSETITELSMRKLRTGDLRSLPTKPTVGDIIDILQKVLETNKATVDRIDPEDLMPMMDAVSGFLPGSRSTGEQA